MAVVCFGVDIFIDLISILQCHTTEAAHLLILVVMVAEGKLYCFLYYF